VHKHIDPYAAAGVSRSSLAGARHKPATNADATEHYTANASKFNTIASASASATEHDATSATHYDCIVRVE
jgi:hypothetical protein